MISFRKLIDTNSILKRLITTHQQSRNLLTPLALLSEQYFEKEVPRITMKGSISLLSLLCCFLLDSRWTIPHFSDAFTLESRLPFSQNDGRDTTRLFGQTPRFQVDSSRRSMLKLAPLAGMALLGSPALAEVQDPFAAMDDMLSSGLPAALPGNSTASGNSDMASALQESKKRRTIDPRTHG